MFNGVENKIRNNFLIEISQNIFVFLSIDFNYIEKNNDEVDFTCTVIIINKSTHLIHHDFSSYSYLTMKEKKNA